MALPVNQGTMSVREYEEYFYALNLIGKEEEESLINIARDGLKKEIREGLDTEEFPNLEALFEEAAEVEKALKKAKSRKRRRANEEESSRKSMRKGDPEDEEEQGGWEEVEKEQGGWEEEDKEQGGWEEEERKQVGREEEEENVDGDDLTDDTLSSG